MYVWKKKKKVCMFGESALILVSISILHPLHSDPPSECNSYQLQYLECV
jgi:hypothetical protein